MKNLLLALAGLFFAIVKKLACTAGRVMLHIFHASRYMIMRIYHGHVLLYCSSLSYSLLVAFIPLVASLSLFAARIYDLNKTKIQFFVSQKEINALILKFLPYSTHTLDAYILKLIKNAATIGWIGTIALLVSVIGLYNTMEEIFNVTWNAGKGRPIHKNIGMIVLLALLFSGAFALYVKVGNLWFLKQYLATFLAGKAVSFLMLVLAFAFLYKMIPRTRVAWYAGLYGGFFAAVLYEICRLGLQVYVTRILAYNKLWGSLSLIPVFILTVYLLSIILVLGNDMTFIAQHYRAIKQDEDLRDHFLRR